MKNYTTILVFVCLLVLAASSRFVSHFWNFTFLGGVFIFAGAYFQDKKISLALMLSTMLLTDWIIGFHNQMPAVYLGYVAVLAIGFLLKPQSSRAKVFAAAVFGSFAFYVISNFGVWLEGALYPKSWQGFMDCYLMALPFYKNQVAGDLISSFLVFESARLLVSIQTKKVEI
jgi:hypothetical protein